MTPRVVRRSIDTWAAAALRTAPEGVARERPGPAPGRAALPRVAPERPALDRGVA
jgi:hypothetical protein